MQESSSDNRQKQKNSTLEENKKVNELRCSDTLYTCHCELINH